MTIWLINFSTQILSAIQYPGLFLLMTAESMIFPIPSEAVMPFAGFLLYTKEMSLWPIIFWSSLGSLAGSLLSYWLGYYGGRPFIIKFGRYFLLEEKHLETTEIFFNRHGKKSIFIGRFIPVIRHLISIPAGLGKMSIWPFIFFTLIGATIWNSILLWAGFYLKENWATIENYTKYIDFILLSSVAIFAIYWFKKKNSAK